MRTGALLQQMAKLHDAAILSMCYCEGSHHVLTSSHDGVIKKFAFSPSTSTKISMDSLDAHSKRINQMTSTEGGGLLFSCSDDGSVRLWNIEQGEMLHSHTPALAISQTNYCYACPAPSMLLFSEKPRRVGTTWGTAGILHVISGALISTLEVPEPVRQFARSSDAITCLEIVSSGRSGPMPLEQQAALISARNNTLQLFGMLDGHGHCVLAPKSAANANTTPGVSATSPSAHKDSAVQACSYQPTLGSVLICWDNGSVDVLDVSSAARGGQECALPITGMCPALFGLRYASECRLANC
jgi:WD40 repeat protein